MKAEVEKVVWNHCAIEHPLFPDFPVFTKPTSLFRRTENHVFFSVGYATIIFKQYPSENYSIPP